MSKFYISTPIYYSSGDPHIGHAYTTILADVINRYKKLLGYDTFFITGMDEHGQKIESIAKNNNISCKELVDKNSNIFKQLWKLLYIEPTYFIRTSNKEHIDFVQKIFSKLFNDDLIYLDNWTSSYCIQCEEDIPENKVNNIDGKKKCEYGHEIILRSEESYFLKTKKFKNWITDIIKKGDIKILPKSRILELESNFLNNNFRDLSISRKEINWAITIKENKNYKIYVWLDALLNYISGLKICDEKFIDFYWNDPKTEIVHLLSKEITRFHCIYWPIILNMLSLRLPSKIISHGWIVTAEGKMSKSFGNVVDPFKLIHKYGADTLRYFLMKEISLYNDSSFSERLLVSTYNSDLSNNFGNIINRTVGLLKKYNNSYIPKYFFPHDDNFIIFKNKIDFFIKEIKDLIDLIEINLIVKRIVIFENEINAFIENEKPWNIFKENNEEKLKNFLSLLTNSVKVLIFFLSPIIVEKYVYAWNQFNFPIDILNILKINDFSLIDNIKINEANILFKRIEEYED